MVARVPAFLEYEVGEDGRVRNLHQSTSLCFRGTESRVWMGGITVPAFWATLFSRDELTASGATTDLPTALERLTRRRESWRLKTSPLVFRGFPRFVDWVASIGSGEVVLDIMEIDAWRHPHLMGALERLIGFLDDESDEPGPLPFGANEVVQWEMSKKGMKLRACVANLRWPDEAPLFDGRCTELTAHTVGVPPFRTGPWPERRLVEGESAVLSPELDAAVKERSTLVRTALQSCPNGIKLTGSIGNRKAIERMRSDYRRMCSDFMEAAGRLMESAAAFSESYEVFDDAGLWQKMLNACRRWEAAMETSLAEQEAAVDAAMKAALDVSRHSTSELDLDDFPSGDDPF